MAPTYDESGPVFGQSAGDNTPISGDSVVITGMAATMPGCRDLDQFAQKLYNKEDLVNGQRPPWSYNHPDVMPYIGSIPDKDRFDAQFFMVNYRLAHTTDVVARKYLELSYQAVIDAGVCPTELSGKRVGVFMCSGVNEVRKKQFENIQYGAGLMGANKAMLANRISYCLNAKGPSYTLEASSCGSLVALEKAYEAILHGYCDSAIVGGARVTMHPHTSIYHQRMVPLNSDGKTKCYDENADGQTMAECTTMFYVQRYRDARRVYAEIYHVKTQFSHGLSEDFKEKFGFYRDPDELAKFLHEFYREAGVSPSAVEYIEGAGAAVREVDKAELQAIEEVFCKDRREPLFVGSVTSNMGMADVTVCGVVKLLLAYQRGEIAANLHCENPRQDISALRDGRMKILTEHQRFKRSFTALNSFSITGLDGHLLLKGLYKDKDISRYHSEIPLMAVVSGRQEIGVQRLLDDIRENDLDPEKMALLHKIHTKRIMKHMARGYGIYSTQDQKTVTHHEKVDYYDDVRRPLWFVYSGMGSQWAGMGAQLMCLPIFAAAIERCDKVLKPKGVNVVQIITSPNKNIFDSILNSFVGIAAIQIGLTDVLRAVGLVPDKIIGHSVGELGCAYADGCATAEEMILLAYSRGLVSTQMTFIKGSMAAVGMGNKQISNLVPPEIEVACHNGPDSCTISGPADEMSKFVDQLTSRGIFAKEVQCSNIAYHSRYVAKAAPLLLKYCKEVMPEPKPRSDRWVSTSFPQNRWDENIAKHASAEYYTNNLLSPVLFEETSRLVPSGAVLVEVAPHGLLQTILRRSLPADCRNVPLTKRKHPDNLLFLLDALGKLYMQGYDMDLSILYPKIEYPVSTQTQQLSSLMEWVHSEQWTVYSYANEERAYSSIYKPIVTICSDEYKYLEGCIMEGVRRFPFAAALVFVWDTLLMMSGRPLRETSVQFQNLKFHNQPIIKENKPLRLVIMVQRGSGHFEVSHESELLAEGEVAAVQQLQTGKTNIHLHTTTDTVAEMDLNTADVYKLLCERGYEYQNEFRAISSANFALNKAQIKWQNNWVTFIDGALQMCILRHDHNGISEPLYIKQISIDVNTHNIIKHSRHNKKETLMEASVLENENTIRCGGMLVKNVLFKDIPLPKQHTVLNTLKFIPFFQEESVDMKSSLYVFLQIVAENKSKDKISVLNVKNSNEPDLLNEIDFMICDQSSVKEVTVVVVKGEDIVKVKDRNEDPDVIVLNHTNCNINVLDTLNYLFPNAFLITIGGNIRDFYKSPSYIQVSAIGKGLSRLELAKWKTKYLSAVALTVGRPEDIPCLNVSISNLQSHQKLVIFTSYPPPNDLKNLVKNWRSEKDSNQICLAMVNDKHKVDMKKLPSFELAFNIFDQNTWGSEYYVPLSVSSVAANDTALRCEQLGDLNSLYWTELPHVLHQPGNVKVEVFYAELNVFDARRALAQLPANGTADQGFGISFSGITESGDNVMGMSPTGSVSSQISCHPGLLWPVPQHWTLEDAATVPLAYSIAFYCLNIKTQLEPGLNVLVHGGAGAVGQAVISIALAKHCTVFTTVSDLKKKKFLRKLFPNLPENHIGNSRDNTFRSMVMHETKGRGCHIIISCVTGLLKHDTVSCSATGGKILDMVQIHTQENYEYGMYTMFKGGAQVNVDISSIFYNQNIDELRTIQLLISEGISGGYVRPLSRVTYAPHDAARAFRLLAASRHRGRVLLRMREHKPQLQPRLTCSLNDCHLLLCDKSEFGVNFADRLVERGVTKLYLHVPIISNHLLFKKQLWVKRGVQVKIASEVLDSSKHIRNLIDDASTLGPVEGLYVIATGVMDDETKTTANAAVANLDHVSRELCPQLRYFAVITEDSAVGIDSVVKRKQMNLNALLLQLKQQTTNTEIKKEKREIRWDFAVSALENALLSKEAKIFAQVQSIRPRNVLQEVANIPGVTITSSVKDDTTLEQVGVDCEGAQQLCSLLEQKFDIHVPKDNVPLMTVKELKDLKMQEVEMDKEEPGFGGCFSFIGDDELQASCDLVFMPTLTHALTEGHNDYEDTEDFLCIVPGMEGHSERFRGLCQLLKLPAVVLQLGPNIVFESIKEIAQYLVEVMTKKLKLNNKFYLLGYELGVSIVMEMASILESRGLTGTVYCLGGTPHDVRTVIENKFQGMTEQSLQVELLKHLYTIMLGEKTSQLDSKLQDLEEYSAKVKYCVDNIRGRVPFTCKYIQEHLEVAYSRLKLSLLCNTEVKGLQAKTVILRAKFPEAVPITSWGFSHQENVFVHELQSTLDHATRDPNCAALVNKHLDTEMLTKFVKRNLCETYVISTDVL